MIKVIYELALSVLYLKMACCFLSPSANINSAHKTVWAPLFTPL